MGFKRKDAEQWVISGSQGSISLYHKPEIYSTEWVKNNYKIGVALNDGEEYYGNKETFPFYYVAYALEKK